LQEIVQVEERLVETESISRADGSELKNWDRSMR
jgi:hypothetical protein